MSQYIDKDKIAAEIERRVKTNKECMLGLRNLDYYKGKIDALNDTLSFLNTLETKGVDLEKEISNYLDSRHLNIQDGGRIVFDNGDTPNFLCDFRDIAKYFFELGQFNTMKEVDFERELGKYVSEGIHRFYPNESDDYYNMDSVVWQNYVIETAEHFYELGLKAQKGG